MSRRFTRLSLWLVFLLSSEVWAIGLGDIELDSALNEPLRAEIVLLSANADELANLTVTLASAETFSRYDLDRPFYLQGIEFNVVDGGAAGSVVQIRSRAPITEPFLTFLVEATWSSGRLLREYTVLLDPPTYAPPTVQQAPLVEAPRRSTPSDSGRIERQAAPTPTRHRHRHRYRKNLVLRLNRCNPPEAVTPALPIRIMSQRQSPVPSLSLITPPTARATAVISLCRKVRPFGASRLNCVPTAG